MYPFFPRARAPFIWGNYMPCPPLACPDQRARKSHFPVRALRCAAVLVGMTLTTPALAQDTTQLWSVHALGVKVGELRVSFSQNGTHYDGSGLFQTTGMVRLLARIKFDVTSQGRITTTGYQPSQYKGHIDTGKRVSKTELAFAGGTVQKVSGSHPERVPIPAQALRGVIDPMTMMWQSLRDRQDTDLCTLDGTQYDGTRVAAIRMTTRQQDGADVTCVGSYDRLAGYTAQELAEMSTSPASVTYQKSGNLWRAIKVKVTTRHGTATLHRRD